MTVTQRPYASASGVDELVARLVDWFARGRADEVDFRTVLLVAWEQQRVRAVFEDCELTGARSSAGPSELTRTSTDVMRLRRQNASLAQQYRQSLDRVGTALLTRVLPEHDWGVRLAESGPARPSPSSSLNPVERATSVPFAAIALPVVSTPSTQAGGAPPTSRPKPTPRPRGRGSASTSSSTALLLPSVQVAASPSVSIPESSSPTLSRKFGEGGSTFSSTTDEPSVASDGEGAVEASESEARVAGARPSSRATSKKKTGPLADYPRVPVEPVVEFLDDVSRSPLVWYKACPVPVLTSATSVTLALSRRRQSCVVVDLVITGARLAKTPGGPVRLASWTVPAVYAWAVLVRAWYRTT